MNKTVFYCFAYFFPGQNNSLCMARSSPNRREEFHVVVQPTPALHGTPSLNTIGDNIRAIADNQHISSTLEEAIKGHPR